MIIDRNLSLKRLRLCRDYWLQIPPERVCPNLLHYVDAPSDSERARFFRAVGLDALRCDAVACLGGWLLTMPGVIEHQRKYGFMAGIESYDLLTHFLSLPSLMTIRLFSTRHYTERHGTDWEVALARLDWAIEEVESWDGGQDGTGSL